MISVCIAGITGWMGRALVGPIEAADDLELVSGVSRSAAGRSLAEAVGAKSIGPVHASVAEAVGAGGVDVVIDYTSATAVRENVWAAVDGGVPVVVGSSGLTGEDYAALDRHARSHNVGVIAAGNFSIQAAVLLHAATLAARHIASWEIIDYAAAQKPDVPSGTARELAETLGAVRTPLKGVAIQDLHGPREARGADVSGTRVHSIRLPGFVVSTEVVFAGAGERLTMKHDPGPGAEPYLGGTLLAVRRVGQRVGVVRGLDTLLFD